MARSRLLLLIAALCGLMACTKSEEGTPDLDGKQFVFRDATWTVALYMDGPITIFKDGAYVHQDFEVSATGTYPQFTFRSREVEMACAFSNPKTFVGTVQKEPGGIDLPSPMTFTQDDSPLDRNGDGLLD